MMMMMMKVMTLGVGGERESKWEEENVCKCVWQCPCDAMTDPYVCILCLCIYIYYRRTYLSPLQTQAIADFQEKRRGMFNKRK